MGQPQETYAERYRRENRELLALKERRRRRRRRIAELEEELEGLERTIDQLLDSPPSSAWGRRCAGCGRIQI